MSDSIRYDSTAGQGKRRKERRRNDSRQRAGVGGGGSEIQGVHVFPYLTPHSVVWGCQKIVVSIG